jgi:tetratricopeptide (TPR) repeat protein
MNRLILIAKIFLAFSFTGSFALAADAGLSVSGSTASRVSANDADYSRAFDFFTKKNYDEAMDLIATIRDSKDPGDAKWDYIEGICLLRLGRLDEAEAKLNTYLKKEETSAKGYYYLGLTSFYKGQYQKALNSFQISQDLSRNSALDRLLDTQMDRSIRFRDYYDGHKPGSFGLFIGYEAHKNVLGLNPDSVEKKISGHILNYGISLGYRPIDRINFVFEPTIVIIDRYTLDQSLKADSILQSLDALQGLVSLPVTFFIGNNSSTQYNLSLNGYSTYLPINTTNRELYLSSVFLKGRVLFDLSQRLSTDISLVAASDKGYNFSSDDDDASGPRSEFTAILKHFLNQERTQIISYGLGASVKNASGVNVRYQKAVATLGYQMPTFWDTESSFDLKYEYLTYPDKATPRKDSKGVFTYTLMQPLNSTASLGYNLGAEVNSSDTELYKYDDYYAGIQFTLSTGF